MIVDIEFRWRIWHPVTEQTWNDTSPSPREKYRGSRLQMRKCIQVEKNFISDGYMGVQTEWTDWQDVLEVMD